MSVPNAPERIQAAVLAWPEMSAHPHHFNAIEFRYAGRREIGHLHSNSLLDIPFPTKLRDELVASGKAEPHHIMPDSGWVSFRIREEADIAAAIELLRRSYQVAAKQNTQSMERTS